MAGARHPTGSAPLVDRPHELRAGRPIDVVIHPNLTINPNYSNYSYLGGGPVYLVPAGKPGAGNLLMVYHAERPTTGAVGFYSM